MFLETPILILTQESIPVGCIPSAAVTVVEGGCTCPGGVPTGGEPAWGGTCLGVPAWGGVPAGGCTCPWGCTRGCTCLEVYLPGGVPAWVVYLLEWGVPARGCTCPGEVYQPEGCTCPGGGVPAQGCTCGVYLAKGCTCWGWGCVSQHALRQTPPSCEQNDRQV